MFKVTTKLSAIILLLIFLQCTNTNGQTRLIDIAHLRSKAKTAKTYCEAKNLNNEFFLLIDLNRHSGLKRFYVWSFSNDTIEFAFLVSHGCGEEPWGEDCTKADASISNEMESHKTSIGKFIVGERGFSNWGINIKYLLYGQERTNSNAFDRQIVLHSWEDVPDVEVFPDGTPEGWGCPAVSNTAMRILDRKLKASEKRVLLWIIK